MSQIELPQVVQVTPLVGMLVGCAVGDVVGLEVVGRAVGGAVGLEVVGCAVGCAVGLEVVGRAVGFAVGSGVATSGLANSMTTSA